MYTSIKRKLIKSKDSLSNTVQKILDINRTKKQADLADQTNTLNYKIEEELKLLNKLAANQAKLVKYYELSLQKYE